VSPLKYYNMNTKINFYCTCLNDLSFEKHIFQVVTEGVLDYMDCKDWLDEMIPIICEEFELSLVFDWVVLFDYEEVEVDTTDVQLVDIIPGKLIFEDDTDQRILIIKAENYELLKEINKLKEPIVKEIPAKRDYESVWIGIDGKTYIVGFACHEEWATEYLQKHNPEFFDEYGIKNSRGYSYDILYDLGWIRILGWKDPPLFVIPDMITPKQKISLREYCIKNSLRYADFPEILKS